jgi:Negative regulator of genetic competence (MecA).
MKIEKINDNQIRCTLNKNDLIDRELKISELAYGTEKARALFRDMIQQAFYEFGFEVDDIPLMIEAIPISPDCLVLVITKVEDPDELDTRFSKFSSFNTNDLSDKLDDDSFGDEIISPFENFEDFDEEIEEPSSETEAGPEPIGISKSDVFISSSDFTKVYTFASLSEVIKLAKILRGMYNGSNSLYKDPVTSTYYLVINISKSSPEEHNKINNIICEYGKPERINYASVDFYEEHYEVIVKDKALQILSDM